MEWFYSTERKQSDRPKGGLASSHEIRSVFAEQGDYLNWIALLITGDDALADQAVVNASDLSANYSSVFRDWLNGWATYATARAAVREVHDLISASATYFVESPSEQADDDVLSDDQIVSLRHIDPREIIAALDLPAALCSCGEYNTFRSSIAHSCWTCPRNCSQGLLPGAAMER